MSKQNDTFRIKITSQYVDLTRREMQEVKNG
jgi:hypothetical protein